MIVSELIAWLQTQPQDLRVDVGMNREYQDHLSLDTCQVFTYDGQSYVLLGEEVYDEVFVNSDGDEI